jgi:hypothetical protein
MLNWEWNFTKRNNLVVSWVSSLPFLFASTTAATYIFTTLTCTTSIITLEPCALNAKFQHFILRFNQKFPYFADTTERGDRGVKERLTLLITLTSKDNCLVLENAWN